MTKINEKTRVATLSLADSDRVDDMHAIRLFPERCDGYLQTPGGTRIGSRWQEISSAYDICIAGWVRTPGLGAVFQRRNIHGN
jgi:hypothetical protein